MISDTPCSTSSRKPTGISSLTGQRSSPPASLEYSLRTIGFDEHRPRQDHDDDRHRQQEEDAADQVDPGAHARRQMAEDHVDPDMLVVQQRVAGGQQEHRREQVPLQFEPGVRAEVEQIARHRIAGADQHRRQDQPVDGMADRSFSASIARLTANRKPTSVLPVRGAAAGAPSSALPGAIGLLAGSRAAVDPLTWIARRSGASPPSENSPADRRGGSLALSFEAESASFGV